MNKEEFRELFQEPLEELDKFTEEIKKIKKLINLIIENYDLLKDSITEEEIGLISSSINIKSTKINSILIDIFSDSKKLESFIHEIKLLKRKRDKKIKTEKISENDELLKWFKQMQNSPVTQPHPLQYPYTTPTTPQIPVNPKWKKGNNGLFF